MSNIAELAGRLSKAQREAVASATFLEEAGVWHPAGWYVHADKRVRYALSLANVTRNYLRRSNRLTSRGEALRAHLLTQEPRK